MSARDRRRFTGVGFILLTGFAGCGGAGGLDAVRSRATFDLRCPEASIDVEETGGRCSYVARGCNQEAAYVVKPPPGSFVCCPPIGCDAELNSEVRSTGRSTASQRAPTTTTTATTTAGTPKNAQSEPAQGAAGFTFKSALETVSKQCTGAGQTWSKELQANHYQCSGPATDVGFTAQVRFKFCEEKLCEITLIAAPKGETGDDWLSQYNKLRRALEQKYGDEHAMSSPFFESKCSGNELRTCLEDGRARASSTWTWRNGQSLNVTLGKGAPGDPKVVLEIVYRDAAQSGPKLEAL